MSDNRNPHRLDTTENERIFREEILPEKLRNNPGLLPSDTPTMLVVGGQPGAGKSHSITAIKEDFSSRGGVLVVDLDAVRENHTAYKSIMRADDKAAAQYTYDNARIWAQKLEDYAKANRYNVLLESLMTSPDGVGS
jgi:Ni2+-binding GTPase involved in maturation of urease and hydrogenase